MVFTNISINSLLSIIFKLVNAGQIGFNPNSSLSPHIFCWVFPSSKNILRLNDFLNRSPGKAAFLNLFMHLEFGLLSSHIFITNLLTVSSSSFTKLEIPMSTVITTTNPYIELVLRISNLVFS